VGLAFSGGGIRSATFNLGILQGLAQAKLLRHMHYLSTVSGGGYIGAWLASWTKRASEGLREVEELLGEFEKHRPSGDLSVEPKEVNFLRDYSNYLTPRKGIFGADTWAAIATYLRNLLLNQAILFGFLGAVLLLPWCLVSAGRWMATVACIRASGGPAAALFAILLLFWAVVWASRQAGACSLTKTDAPKSAEQKFVISLIAIPILLSALLAVIALWLGSNPNLLFSGHPKLAWIVFGALLYGMAHVIGTAVREGVLRRSNQQDAKLTISQWVLIPLSAVVAGAAGGLLLKVVASWLAAWKLWPGGIYQGMSWGPPLVAVVFLLTGTLHIGLLKLLIENEEQEWWGRLGGWLLLVSLGWAAVFGLSIHVPWLLAIFSQWAKTKTSLLLGWAGTTLSGLFLGKSDKTSGKADGNSSLELVAVVAPYVFLLGLMCLLSLGVFWLGGQRLDLSRGMDSHAQVASQATIAADVAVATAIQDAGSATGKVAAVSGGAADSMTGSLVIVGKLQATVADEKTRKSLDYWNRTAQLRVSWLWSCMLILALLALALACRVDINIFSMNLLYRNRLVRCYLGASRQGNSENMRRPNPFTGFDPADDISLTELRKGSGYEGPYPIVCAALNVTHGERLAWQERKAESFVFTPHYCGYEFPEMNLIQLEGNSNAGYSETEKYAFPKRSQDPFHKTMGGVHLGTAISISGAAASPNMGYHTSPPLAFLMTVFNVRLGWWLANPRYSNDRYWFRGPKGGPRCSLLYLLCELFASTTDRSKYVYLSDGGHFENLGIYELVRRRCKYIIACDAGEDHEMKFGDLGNAIRKCRSDFGVKIEIDTSKLVPVGDPKFALVHGVLGKIYYPKGANDEQDFTGDILYIKPTITADVPRDVLAYRDTHASFPHQSTADQWFDESQFESYRMLGFHSFESLVEGGGKTEPLTIPQFFDGVSRE
jgi:hypothetical protein